MLLHILETPYSVAFTTVLTATNIRVDLFLSPSTKVALWWHKAKESGDIFPKSLVSLLMPTSNMMKGRKCSAFHCVFVSVGPTRERQAQGTGFT